MKVLVLSTKVPFVHGGAEELFDHLVRNLQAAGVEAEGMRLPFTWNPAERLIDEMLIARRLCVSRVDRVIALKFPAYLVPAPDKVLMAAASVQAGLRPPRCRAKQHPR